MKKVILILLSSALVLLFLSYRNSSENAASSQEYCRMGISLSKLGDFDQPLEYYQNNTKRFAKNAEAYYELGLAYEKAGELDNAITALGEAISLDPAYFDAYYDLGNVYGVKGEYEKETEYLKKALKLNPSYSNVYYFSRISHGRKKIYNLAIKCFLQSIKIKPDNIETYYALADLYAKLAKVYSHEIYRDKEIECWKHVARLKPNDSYAWFRMGGIFLLKSRHRAALECFDKAIEHGSKNLPEIYANSGFIYMEKKEYAKALFYFLKVISLEPQNKEILTEAKKANFYLNKKPIFIK